MSSPILPVGKLPASLLSKLLTQAPVTDPAVIVGPGVGLDCAVVDAGNNTYHVYKSDPITFAIDEMGWYLVQINANDIATTGATPRWLLLTALLPEGKTTAESAAEIYGQVTAACRHLNISLIGGHTEITYGLDRPLLIGTLVGTVAHDALINPQNIQPGDRLLLTKGVPIEATAILAREMASRLADYLTPAEITQAQAFLHNPGISVTHDAQIAIQAGGVTGMHDPTEGGLAGALWELAEACGCSLTVDVAAVPLPALSAKICHVLELDPLAAIASGALLIACKPEAVKGICMGLENAGIRCTEIGHVEAGDPVVWQRSTPRQHLPRPLQDEIARLFV